MMIRPHQNKTYPTQDQYKIGNEYYSTNEKIMLKDFSIN